MNDYNKDEFQKEPLYVDVAQTKKQRKKMFQYQTINQERTNMYIKNIKPTVTPEQFKQAMAKYGDVQSAILKPFTGFKNQGEVQSQFGFVNYKTNEQAMELLRS